MRAPDPSDPHALGPVYETNVGWGRSGYFFSLVLMSVTALCPPMSSSRQSTVIF